jgi:membrane-associated phospholipid phosphatase
LFNSLGIDLPPTVEGVHIWDALNSFPSGHTSCVFVFFAGIAAILPYRYRFWQIFIILFAFLTGFSRIYLSQHFLADVLFGALIGMISTVITYVIVYYKERGNINLIRTGLSKLGLIPNS